MKIVICASVDFTPKIKEAAEKLIQNGHEVDIPYYSQKIIDGEVSLEDYVKIKEEKGDTGFREKADEDLIKRYFGLIKNSDAILVLNLDKKGVKNYIGGSTLMEMGFAYVLDKRIFLYNNIPYMGYSDEIKDTKPMIINGDLTKIEG